MTALKNSPAADPSLFLTDGGLETTLVFLEGFELPCFAAFDLFKDEKGYKALKHYYQRYLDIAKAQKMNFILETPTWRANPGWIEKSGYPATALEEVNKKSVMLMQELRAAYEKDIDTILISGCIGPAGDGYQPGNKMSWEEAAAYHLPQIKVLSDAGADMVSAITMNYAEEAIGITRAAATAGIPVVISFTLETDGRLPSGMSLAEAIQMVENDAAPAPLYYMINCAHPGHFSTMLNDAKNEAWVKRIQGLRANASCKSHAELDESTELDRGNPEELGDEHVALQNTFPHLNVFGGCCGTDEAHVEAIAKKLKR